MEPQAKPSFDFVFDSMEELAAAHAGEAAN